jgi:hypothetical protein
MDGRPPTEMAVSMRHVVEFLQQYLREHWAELRHATGGSVAIPV